MSNYPLIEPSVAFATEILRNIQKLVADYWVLHGAFGKDQAFQCAGYNISKLCEMETIAADIVKDLNGNPLNSGKHIQIFSEIANSYENIYKKDLTNLRKQLEGPTWHDYKPEVSYEIIGNQPNPGQTGAPNPAAKRRKSTRAATSTRKSSAGPRESSPKICSVANTDVTQALNATKGFENDMQSGRPPLLSKRHASFISCPPCESNLPSWTAVNSSSVDNVNTNFDPKDEEIARLQGVVAEMHKNQREAMTSFSNAIAHFERQNTELENRIHSLIILQTQEITSKDRIIAEKEAIIAHKDMIVAKYKMLLTVHGAEIDETNGERI